MMKFVAEGIDNKADSVRSISMASIIWDICHYTKLMGLYLHIFTWLPDSKALAGESPKIFKELKNSNVLQVGTKKQWA